MRLINVILVSCALVAATRWAPASGQILAEEWLIGPADSVRGTLGPGDAVLEEDETYYDAYILPVTAGVQYTIGLDSDDFDPYLIVQNHTTGKTSQDDDGGTGANSLLSLTTETDGFVVVIVNSYKEGAGDYSLTIK